MHPPVCALCITNINDPRLHDIVNVANLPLSAQLENIFVYVCVIYVYRNIYFVLFSSIFVYDFVQHIHARK